MGKSWFRFRFQGELQYRCRLSKSMDSLGSIENTSIENTSVNEDPARNDMDKNIHGWSDSSSYYSKVDHLFGVKDIRKFISDSDDPFLIVIRGRSNQEEEGIDNDHSFLSELESFLSSYCISIRRNNGSKNDDPHYDFNLYDTNSSWNNQIKGSIHSFLRSKICRDSAILSGSDNSNAISNSSCGEGGNGSEGKNFNFNIRTHGNDNDLTLKESSNNSKESSNNSNNLSLYSKNVDLYRSLWVQCENENCYGLNYKKFLKSQMNMCEYCGYHFKMNNSSDRIELLIDPGTWSPMDEDMISLDPSEFLSDEDEEGLSYFDEEEPSDFDEDEEELSDFDEEEPSCSYSDEDEEEPSCSYSDEDEEKPSDSDEGEEEDEEKPSDSDEDEEERSSFREDEEELSDFDEDEEKEDEDEEKPSDSDEGEEEDEEKPSDSEEDEDEEELSYSEEDDDEEELSYKDRIDSYQRKTGLTEAIQTGTGQLKDIPIAIGVMDFQFIGGSMGSVVGEKITRLIEYASNHFLPLILVCASGGARMQEGSLSLMQMAKISSALYDYQINKKLFYVAILTSPTTGGVTASFGMLGDIIIAEPNALIAFAGKRIIEQLLHITVPEGFQETENLFGKGLFDLILPRNRVKDVLSELLQLHGFFPLNQN
uniref:acetyl-CoA carboxylase subunit beta n=1 Tax=Helicteres hirsuta TaxID=1489665 RepID=UPI002E78E9C2|nr:acetyl-CoA carboxylase subunit beta [Helicteres hirsuta]WPV76323.1 acetyl-CoA carboxylase subunit beta [Helicteres hirsuta]